MKKTGLAFFAATLEGLEAMRAAEVNTIAEILGLQNSFKLLDDPSDILNALCRVEVDRWEDLEVIAARSVLLHNVGELMCVGSSIEELMVNLAAMDYATVFRPYMGAGHTFKLHLEGWGKAYTQSEKVAIYNLLDKVFPREGTVDVVRPETTFWIFIDHHRNHGRASFVRLVADSGRKKLLHHYALSSRPHIGTTTMPPELCFVMASLAKVRKGSFVYDCFCGTGSTLVSAAVFGAVCMGSDRDARTMRSNNSSNASIFHNFSHYGLKHGIDLLRLSADTNMVAWRCHEMFDAILSDPPYGIREPSKKIDRKRCDQLASTEKFMISPPSETYAQSEMETDFIAFAAKSLRVKGRVVFWHPTLTEFDVGELPSHPCLQIVGIHPQAINLRCSRQLVIMEKVVPWNPEMKAVPPTVTRDLRALYFSQVDTSTKPPEGSTEATPYEKYQAKRAKKKEAVIRYQEEMKKQQE
eukprot:PhF_6_TR25146/c0_g1_i2/m.34639/K15430/TRM11, TRMT11; tRNA (guanine10-N2)-methyltransferase